VVIFLPAHPKSCRNTEGSLPVLVEISSGAFYNYVGEVQFVGSPLPKLQSIGNFAFDFFDFVSAAKLEGNTSSVLEMYGLASLEKVGCRAFLAFAGTLQFTGAMPLLKEIASRAFRTGNSRSSIDIYDLWSLELIGVSAFKESKSQIRIAGAMPHFGTLDRTAFASTDNKENSFNVTCISKGGVTIGTNALPTLRGGSSTLLFREEPCTCDNWPCNMFVTVDAVSTISTTASTSTTATVAASDDDNAGAGCMYNCNRGAATINTSNTPANRTAMIASITVALLLLCIMAAAVVHHRRRRISTTTDGSDYDVCGWTPAARRERKLMQELAAATYERGHLTFLASYSRKLFGEVASAGEHKADMELLEVPRKLIQFQSTLGEGNYGIVRLANIKQQQPQPPQKQRQQQQQQPLFVPALTRTVVAIKSRPTRATDATIDEALFIEALVLQAVYHPNVLKLVGICTDALPFLVLTELMVNGDLKSYLRLCRPTEPAATRKAVLTLLDAIVIVEKVCSAMRHLEGLEVIHRDIAARNVLVGGTPTDVKLGDLGAARSVFRLADREYSATTEHMPARWMAPESLKAAIFSSKTDVWGFGVLCWEVTSLGQVPYGALGVKDMVDSLTHGDRLPAPPFTPPGLHKVLLLCWSLDPKRRPRFSDLVHNIGAIRGAIAVSPDAYMTLSKSGTLVPTAGVDSDAANACYLDIAARATAVLGDPVDGVATASTGGDGYETFLNLPTGSVTQESGDVGGVSGGGEGDGGGYEGSTVSVDIRDGYDIDPNFIQTTETSLNDAVMGGSGDNLAPNSVDGGLLATKQTGSTDATPTGLGHTASSGENVPDGAQGYEVRVASAEDETNEYVPDGYDEHLVRGAEAAAATAAALEGVAAAADGGSGSSAATADSVDLGVLVDGRVGVGGDTSHADDDVATALAHAVLIRDEVLADDEARL
jgi:serine/threonine protein kinase